MALTSREALYIDKDPNGPETGRILPEGDPDARFLLIGAGGVLSDDLEKKFGKVIADHDATSPYDEAAARAELVKANRQTYADNAAILGGPAYKGIPGEETNLAGVAPDKQESANGILVPEVKPVRK